VRNLVSIAALQGCKKMVFRKSFYVFTFLGFNVRTQNIMTQKFTKNVSVHYNHTPVCHIIYRHVQTIA